MIRYHWPPSYRVYFVLKSICIICILGFQVMYFSISCFYCISVIHDVFILVRRLTLCEELKNSSCGSLLFSGLIPPPNLGHITSHDLAPTSSFPNLPLSSRGNHDKCWCIGCYGDVLFSWDDSGDTDWESWQLYCCCLPSICLPLSKVCLYVCLSVCVMHMLCYACMCACVRLCVYVCLLVYMCLWLYVCVGACTYVCACAHTLAQTLLHAHASLSMSFCAVLTVQISMVYSQ